MAAPRRTSRDLLNHRRTDSDDPYDPYQGPSSAAFAPPTHAAPPAGQQRRESGYFRPVDYEEEDDVGFNVYDDFNNAGPRYAAQPQHASIYSAADIYHSSPASGPGTPLPAYGGHHPSHSRSNSGFIVDKSGSNPYADSGRPSSSTTGLVVAPKKGGEWGSGEAKKERPVGPSKRSGLGPGGVDNRPKWQRDREEKWRRIRKKMRPTWRQGVFVVVFLIVAVILLCYFLVPRVPHFYFDTQGDGPLSSTAPSDSLAGAFSRTPASFSFPAQANLGVDAKANWLPLKFSSLSLEMRLLDTGKLVGTGEMGGTSVDGRELSPFTFPFTFSYRGGNISDATWVTMHNACAHRWGGQPDRPLLNLSLRINMKIAGLIGTKSTSTQLNTIACPIELPGNAV